MNKKRLQWLAYSAGGLLCIMGAFHGSGLFFISEQVHASNLLEGIKSIFPVLFILPSIELFGLGALSFLAPRLDGQKTYLVYAVVFFLVLMNALLALYLNAWIPAVALLIPALCLLVITLQLRTQGLHPHPNK